MMLMSIPDKPETIDYDAMVEAMKTLGLVTDVTPIQSIESVSFEPDRARVVYTAVRGREIIRISREIPYSHATPDDAA